MGKALVIKTADFTNISVSMSDIVFDKALTTEELHTGTLPKYSNSSTGALATGTNVEHKIVNVEGYSKIIVSGNYGAHIGAFYNSKDVIGTSTFVSCNGALTKSGDGTISGRIVNIPEGAIVVSINIRTNQNNQTLELKK